MSPQFTIISTPCFLKSWYASSTRSQDFRVLRTCVSVTSPTLNNGFSCSAKDGHAAAAANPPMNPRRPTQDKSDSLSIYLCPHFDF